MFSETTIEAAKSLRVQGVLGSEPKRLFLTLKTSLSALCGEKE